MRLSSVLFPTDFSPAAHAALEVAMHVARESGATLHVVHVVPPVTDPGDAAERLKQLHASLADDVAIETALLSGRVAQRITAYARDRAIQLIVLGSHGRTGLSRAILGSVAEAVLRHAPCLVLSVPPAVLDPSQVAPAAPEVSKSRVCIVCAAPTDDLACERCRARIRGEALAQKRAAERPGHHGLPV